MKRKQSPVTDRASSVLASALGLAASIALGSCADDGPDLVGIAQESRAGAGGNVGFDLLVTDGGGAPVTCDGGSLDVTMRASQLGTAGPFTPIPARNIVVQCASGAADVAIVVDNSGSEAGHLPRLQAATKALVASVTEAGGRASLVRVSTNNEVMAPLTADREVLESAIDELYVANGWTALWDGVRVGNETLGGEAIVPTPASDVRTFCSASRKVAIVAFTDGQDNNSADQASYDHAKYPGDGLATTVDDLASLSVGRVTTPIHTIGLGRDVDGGTLTSIAHANGGSYHHADDADALAGVFDDIAGSFGASHQVCADLPWSVCGDVDVETTWTWTGVDGRVLHGSEHTTLAVPCEEARSPGRSATIVLTMSNAGIDHDTASRLAANAVDWVAPVSQPSVLVVLDDGHHGEFVGDAAYVRDLLAERGYQVTLTDERAGGITPADVAGYDVVWFTNPGYPWDDARSVDTLRGVLAAGGGVIAQGDDITWSMGRSFDVSALTHLTPGHNGTDACGTQTDNNAGAMLEVELAEGHPLLEGIEHMSFLYGDDIDVSTPVGDGELVLGDATLAGGACGESRPVLTVFQPPTE